MKENGKGKGRVVSQKKFQKSARSGFKLKIRLKLKTSQQFNSQKSSLLSFSGCRKKYPRLVFESANFSHPNYPFEEYPKILEYTDEKI